MPDLFLEDADLAAEVLDGHGYPQLATTVRGLIDRVDDLVELLDAELEHDRGAGLRYQLTRKGADPALVYRDGVFTAERLDRPPGARHPNT